jgi:hypothetical protein
LLLDVSSPLISPRLILVLEKGPFSAVMGIIDFSTMVHIWFLMAYMSSNLAAIEWRWIWLFLVHKRRQESLLKRHIRHLIFDNSRYDRERAEHVSLVSRIELLDLVQPNSDLSVFPDVIKGEILIDSRGRGSLQTSQKTEAWSTLNANSRKDVILGSLNACRRVLKRKLDTQRIRFEIVKKLRDIFNDAHFLAKKGKDFKEREKWARVAAYAAQTIDGLCSRFDEREIDENIIMLERLTNEAEAKDENKTVEQENGGA